MKKYEGIFILDADAGEAVKKNVKTLTEPIQKAGGTVADTQEWGRRRLGHPIGARRDGFFVHVDFSVKPESLARIQSQFKLNENILKFMVTRVESVRPFKIRVRKKPDAKKPETKKGEAHGQPQ